jgi:hypothetical protein
LFYFFLPLRIHQLEISNFRTARVGLRRSHADFVILFAIGGLQQVTPGIHFSDGGLPADNYYAILGTNVAVADDWSILARRQRF